MATPPFLLRIADQEGEAVTLPAGGASEHELIALITSHIVNQGDGF